MNSALTGLRPPAPVAAPVDPINSGMAKAARGLIWVYLVLWVVEGALRKWFLVSLSDVLLVIRDPVVLGIYATALIGGLFPFNAFFFMTLLVAALSGMAGFAVIPDLPAVVAFGLRANFLHLPLIFVMGRVLRPKDLRLMAWFFLIGAIPQAAVMAKQYRSGINDWWNLGAGGGQQIEAASNVVRPAGTFSFISGPILYFGATTAFLLGGLTLRGWIRWWLMIPVVAASLLAAAVSGSRSLMLSSAIVGLTFLVGCVLYPRAIKSLAKLFVMGLIGFAAVAGLSVYQAGVETTGDRAAGATQNEGGLVGLAARALKPISDALSSVFSTELLGKGLGLGTNGGASLAGFRGNFLIAEDEWTRAVGESGPVIGLAFMGLRVGLAVWALVLSLRAARNGNLLPIALWGAGAVGLVAGQFGQPTAMGATVFFMGLWAASLAIPKSDTIFVDKVSAVTTALDSAKTGAPVSMPPPGNATAPSRATPFNVVPRPVQPKPTPPSAHAKDPVPEQEPAIPKPVYKPGRFAVHGRNPKSSEE
jgi:hypothetical protein